MDIPSSIVKFFADELGYTPEKLAILEQFVYEQFVTIQNCSDCSNLDLTILLMNAVMKRYCIH